MECDVRFFCASLGLKGFPYKTLSSLAFLTLSYSILYIMNYYCVYILHGHGQLLIKRDDVRTTQYQIRLIDMTRVYGICTIHG